MHGFHGLRRQPTDPALERARQNQRRPTLPSEKKSGAVQDKYPAYEDFAWEKIEEFLRAKGPAWQNFALNPKRFGDNWQFEVPEKLTEGDRRQLRQLRDAPNRTRNASESPEPEPEPEPEPGQ